jgi:aminoglycoside phosphotransferase (APT) family kinase protein
VDATGLARRFGLSGPARLSDGPVARGKQGVMWRLDTDDGAWAVKVPFDATVVKDHATFAAFQEAALAAGVPTPEVRRTPDGAVFADVGGERVRLYGWVDLLDVDLLIDPVAVGRTLALLHQVPFDEPGEPDPWFEEPVDEREWTSLVDALLAAGAPFAPRLAELRPALAEVAGWVTPPGRTRMCHRDLWADNLRATAHGGLCVIDWEDCGAAEPARELACAIFEFGRHDAGRARSLHDAYVHAGGPARVRHREDFSMLVAQLDHIAHQAASDWLAPNPRSPDRAAASAWVGEVLDDPHTPEVLDDLLAAVR